MNVFTATEKLKEIERELGYRRHVYPRRISEARMTKAAADRQTTIMEAIAEDYRQAAEKERLL